MELNPHYHNNSPESQASEFSPNTLKASSRTLRPNVNTIAHKKRHTAAHNERHTKKVQLTVAKEFNFEDQKQYFLEPIHPKSHTRFLIVRKKDGIVL
jgi:hypothetical protein